MHLALLSKPSVRRAGKTQPTPRTHPGRSRPLHSLRAPPARLPAPPVSCQRRLHSGVVVARAPGAAMLALRPCVASPRSLSRAAPLRRCGAVRPAPRARRVRAGPEGEGPQEPPKGARLAVARGGSSWQRAHATRRACRRPDAPRLGWPPRLRRGPRGCAGVRQAAEGERAPSAKRGAQIRRRRRQRRHLRLWQDSGHRVQIPGVRRHFPAGRGEPPRCLALPRIHKLTRQRVAAAGHSLHHLRRAC